MPIVAPLWPAFLIYHRFCGVRRSQRHNLTPIAPESSIREAVSAPTATLLSGPASCLDAGHAFLCAIAFSGENTTLRATSISFGELRDARFARHNPRRPWGPGLIKESRSVVGGSRVSGAASVLAAQTAMAQQATAVGRATGAIDPNTRR